MKRVAVAGLGIIGRIWAQRYLEAGLLAAVWNRTPKPDSPRWCASVADAARSADVLHVVVADPAAVEQTLRAALPALGPGKLVLQSSTIDPDSADAFHALVTATGASYVEAPFTGSQPAAEAGKTVFYLGGDAEQITALGALLAPLSEKRLHVGDRRAAAALKLALNVNVAVQVEGLCEALTLARRAGVDDAVFFAALDTHATRSPLVAMKTPKLRDNEFSPQFSVKHLEKDLRLAEQLGGETRYPALSLVRTALLRALEGGHGEEDFAMLIRLL